MKSTLTTLAILCALVWGGLRMWTAFQNVSPMTRAQWCMEGGEYEEAIAHLQDAETQDPNNMQVQIALAECYDRLGDKATAAKMYKEARPAIDDPDAPPAMEYHRDRLAILESLGY